MNINFKRSRLSSVSVFIVVLMLSLLMVPAVFADTAPPDTTIVAPVSCTDASPTSSVTDSTCGSVIIDPGSGTVPAQSGDSAPPEIPSTDLTTGDTGSTVTTDPDSGSTPDQSGDTATPETPSTDSAAGDTGSTVTTDPGSGAAPAQSGDTTTPETPAPSTDSNTGGTVTTDPGSGTAPAQAGDTTGSTSPVTTSTGTVTDSTYAPVTVPTDTVVDSTYAPVTETLPPIADDQSVTTDRYSNLAITLTGSDADQDELTFSIVTEPQKGTLNVNGSTVTYIPSLDYVGNDSFTFKVNNGMADSNVATVNIVVTDIIDTWANINKDTDDTDSDFSCPQ